MPGAKRHPAWNRAQIARGGINLGQRRQRHAEKAAEFSIPFAGLKIHQRGARGGGDVGLEAPRQPVAEVGIGRSRPQMPRCGNIPGAGDVAQDPARCRGREIAIERQISPHRDLGRSTFGLHRGGGCAVVLPDDDRADGTAVTVTPPSDRAVSRSKTARDIGQKLLGFVLDMAGGGVDPAVRQ